MNTETKLRNMSTWIKALNSLLSIIREDGPEGPYLIVEHEEYGHITELHLDDFPNYKEIVREALAEASGETSELEEVPW